MSSLVLTAPAQLEGFICSAHRNLIEAKIEWGFIHEPIQFILGSRCGTGRQLSQTQIQRFWISILKYKISPLIQMLWVLTVLCDYIVFKKIKY